MANCLNSDEINHIKSMYVKDGCVYASYLSDYPDEIVFNISMVNPRFLKLLMFSADLYQKMSHLMYSTEDIATAALKTKQNEIIDDMLELMQQFYILKTVVTEDLVVKD